MILVALVAAAKDIAPASWIVVAEKVEGGDPFKFRYQPTPPYPYPPLINLGPSGTHTYYSSQMVIHDSSKSKILLLDDKFSYMPANLHMIRP